VHKKPAMGLISTKMNEIQPKIVVEFELRVFDHFGGKQNYCVDHNAIYPEEIRLIYVIFSIFVNRL
jgi:hypothetical protein